MTSTTTMERTGMGVPGLTFPGWGQQTLMAPGVGTTPFTTPTVNYFNVPRCNFKVERTNEGCKVYCLCEEQTSQSVVQNLCTVLNGGNTCCCFTYNGVTVCTYNFTLGLCRWEIVDKGVCFSCTSGDPRCCASLQTLCDCFTAMVNAGCYCTFYVNQTPMCCGTTDMTSSKTGTPARKS
jgi:hypothetical protein